MVSYWKNEYNFNEYISLDKDIDVDVCIIGAGITGIMTAYKLIGSGLKVCLVDSGRICDGVTVNTTAKLTSMHGLIYKYLIDSFDKDFAMKYLESNEQAILDVKEISEKEKIHCDFTFRDNYIYTCSEQYVKKIRDEVLALDNLGKKAEFVTKSELPFDILAGIKTANQASFNPIKYLEGIVKVLEKNGVLIFENTRIINIEKEEEYKVSNENNTITAEHVVLATHYPIKNFPGMYFLKMYQDASHVVCVEAKNHKIDGMYLCAENETSFRPIDKNTIFIGGEGHKTGDNSFNVEDVYSNLSNFTDEVFPNCNLKFYWENQDCITLDKVPYIRRIF